MLRKHNSQLYFTRSRDAYKTPSQLYFSSSKHTFQHATVLLKLLISDSKYIAIYLLMLEKTVNSFTIDTYNYNTRVIVLIVFKKLWKAKMKYYHIAQFLQKLRQHIIYVFIYLLSILLKVLLARARTHTHNLFIYYLFFCRSLSTHQIIQVLILCRWDGFSCRNDFDNNITFVVC